MEYGKYIEYIIDYYFKQSRLSYKTPSITICTSINYLPIEYKLIFSFPKGNYQNEIILILKFKSNQDSFQGLVITEKTSELNLNFNELKDIISVFSELKDYLQKPLEIQYQRQFFS